MAKLVDALVSGTSVRKDVQVRVLFWAQKKLLIRRLRAFFCYGYFAFFLSQDISVIVLFMIPMASLSCSSLISSGGAKRMMC